MKKSLFMLGVAVAALASCTNEEVVSVPESRAISFKPFVNYSTRANVTETTGANLTSFYVFGNYTEGTWTPVFTNVEVKGGTVGESGTTSWTPTQNAYWQASQKYRFAAYSNGNAQIENAAFSASEQKLTFSSYSPTSTSDLIVAVPKEMISAASTTDNEPVDLSFIHMLSEIKFTFNNTDSYNYTVEISDIKVNAVKTATGTCTYAESTPTINWTTSQSNGDYEFGTLKDIAQAVDAEKHTHDVSLFVIPQGNTNSLNVTFTATISDESGKLRSSKFTATLGYEATSTEEGSPEVGTDNTWTPGYRYNYVATLNGSQIKDDDDPSAPDLQPIKFDVVKITDWVEGNSTTVTPTAD